jgi:hypothetical protein
VANRNLQSPVGLPPTLTLINAAACPTYCNVLVGSISQWNFIALRIQYTTVDYSQQLYNTRPNSTSSLTQLTQITIGSAPNTTSELFKLSRTTDTVHSKSLYTSPRHNHSNVSVLTVALLRKLNKPIVTQQELLRY